MLFTPRLGHTKVPKLIEEQAIRFFENSWDEDVHKICSIPICKTVRSNKMALVLYNKWNFFPQKVHIGCLLIVTRIEPSRWRLFG